MLELFDDFDGSATAVAALQRALEAQAQQVAASLGQGDPDQVARAEAEVQASPSRAFRFDASGRATLEAAGRRYQAGRFEVLRLCELRSRAWAARARAGRPPARRRLWVFTGTSPITDIGALQAMAAPGSMFQVASQFNCLESPGNFLTPVQTYLSDPTQGPRASISAFPATLLRHYAAPAEDGGRFVQQQDGAQVNLLADVCAPGVASVSNGYLLPAELVDAPAFARALEERFEAIAVGVHDGAEVVLGANWTGGVPAAPHRTIAQVFTSTVASGSYGRMPAGAASQIIYRQLQRAAYLGTLLAAAALGQRRVVLTLIGGGVFANPIAEIWDAILWAADAVVDALHVDLSILVNGRTLSDEVPAHVLHGEAAARGGQLVSLDRGGARLRVPG